MAIDHCGAKGMASGKLQLHEMLDETQHPPISRVYLDGTSLVVIPPMILATRFTNKITNLWLLPLSFAACICTL
jgi:hypothetical protein